MVLDVVGAVYSGDKRLLEVGLTVLNAVVMQCRRNGYLKGGTPIMDPAQVTRQQGLGKAWALWVHEETCRRLVCGVWVIALRFPAQASGWTMLTLSLDPAMPALPQL